MGPTAVFTDLDGTLLNADHQLSEGNRRTLTELGNNGICRVVATGRSLYSAKRVLDQAFPIDYLITSTGAGIFSFPSLALLRSVALTVSEVETTVEKLIQRGLDFMIQDPVPHNHRFSWHTCGRTNPDFERRLALYHDHQRRLPMPFTSIAPAAQLLVICSAGTDQQLQQKLRAELPTMSVIRTTSPLDHDSMWIEIFPGNVSKSQAATWLCAELSLDSNKALVIGNDYNDLDLLEWGTTRYVVANAPDYLRSHFPEVADHNADGFSEAVGLWLSQTYPPTG